MPENLNNKGFGVVPLLLVAAAIGTAGFIGFSYFSSRSELGDVLQANTSSKPVPCTGSPSGNNAYKYENGKNCFYTFRSNIQFVAADLDRMKTLQDEAAAAKPSRPNPFPNFVRPPKNSAVYMSGIQVAIPGGKSGRVGLVTQIADPAPITIANNRYGDIQFRAYRNVLEYGADGKRVNNKLTVLVKLSGPRITLKKGVLGQGNVVLLRGADADATIDANLFSYVTSGFVNPTPIATVTRTATATPRPSGTPTPRPSPTPTRAPQIPTPGPTITPAPQTSLTPYQGAMPLPCSFSRPAGYTSTFSIETSESRKGQNCYFDYTIVNPNLGSAFNNMLSANQKAGTGSKPYNGFFRPAAGRAQYYADNGPMSGPSSSACLGLSPNGQKREVIRYVDSKYGRVDFIVWQNVVTYNTGFKLDTNRYIYLTQLRGPKVTVNGADILCRGTLRLSLDEYRTLFNRIRIDVSGFNNNVSIKPVDKFAPEYKWTTNNGAWPNTLGDFMSKYIDNQLVSQTIREYFRTNFGTAFLIDVPNSPNLTCSFGPNGQKPSAQRYGNSTYELYNDVYLLTPNRQGGYQAIAQTSGPKLAFRASPDAFEKCGVIFFRKGTQNPISGTINVPAGAGAVNFDWKRESFSVNKAISDWISFSDSFQRSQIMGYYNLLPKSGTGFILDGGPRSTQNPNTCGFFLNGQKGVNKTLVVKAKATNGSTIDVKANYQLFNNVSYIDKEGRSFKVNVVAQTAGPRLVPTNADAQYRCGVIVLDPKVNVNNPPITLQKVKTTSSPTPTPTPGSTATASPAGGR